MYPWGKGNQAEGRAECKGVQRAGHKVWSACLRNSKEASEAETDLEGLGSSRRVGQTGER